MRIWKDQKGFSLIEIMIVAGIVGILAGISLRMVGHLKYYDIEKSIQYVSDALNKQQMKSMSKENKPYLYIYEYGGSYYYCLTDTEATAPSDLGTKGKEISTGATISYTTSGVTKTIEGNLMLCIIYKKDGSFKECPDVIKIENNSASQIIKFNRLTGKHVISTN